MKVKSLFKAILVCLIYLLAVSFQSAGPLTGVWEYAGGIYHGQADPPPRDIKLQRVYTETGYQGFIIKKGSKNVKYEAGKYALSNNFYRETPTYSNQSSPLKGIMLHYTYTIHNNVFIYKGKLPDKTSVEEHWKRIK